MAFQFRHGPFSMSNFKASDEYLKIGNRVVRSYPLVDIDEINLPSLVKPYTQTSINGYAIATDLLSFLTQVPHADCVVYNQVVQIPEQRKLLRKLQGKAKRHGSMPDPSNKIAKADIEEVLQQLAVDSTLLVYTNFNILVSCQWIRSPRSLLIWKPSCMNAASCRPVLPTISWNCLRTASPATAMPSIRTMTSF